MPEETTITHVYPEPITESVKLEKNSRGWNYEVKALSPARAWELADEIEREIAKRVALGKSEEK